MASEEGLFPGGVKFSSAMPNFKKRSSSLQLFLTSHNKVAKEISGRNEISGQKKFLVFG
jgi:hypothetical protein